MTNPRPGLALLDKPRGMTSFAALRAVKDAIGSRRVGHAGTLDPFATGLLVVLTGAYTRLAWLLSGLDKTYRARMVFGAETDTLDLEGSIVARGPIPTLRDIRMAAAGFTGVIEQVPPAYSAIHVEGRRAHELARAGAPPGLPPRQVTIRRLEILQYEPPELEIEVECSKGTYIRALARDLGLAVRSRGHLCALRRTAVGPFAVEEARVPEQFEPAALMPARTFLERLEGIRCRSVGAESALAVLHGRPLEDRTFGGEAVPDGAVALFDAEGRLLAVAQRQHGRYRYLAVLAQRPADRKPGAEPET